MPTLHSRLTLKGQATIPKPVRDHLGLHQGDRVVFVMEDDQVILRKATALDLGLLKLSEEALADWNSPEADEAFRDL